MALSLVWSGPCEQRTGLLATGDVETPSGLFICASQLPTAVFTKFLIDGNPTGANTVDEVAFPILLAWHLQKSAR